MEPDEEETTIYINDKSNRLISLSYDVFVATHVLKGSVKDKY